MSREGARFFLGRNPRKGGKRGKEEEEEDVEGVQERRRRRRVKFGGHHFPLQPLLFFWYGWKRRRRRHLECRRETQKGFLPSSCPGAVCSSGRRRRPLDPQARKMARIFLFRSESFRGVGEKDFSLAAKKSSAQCRLENQPRGTRKGLKAEKEIHLAPSHFIRPFPSRPFLTEVPYTARGLFFIAASRIKSLQNAEKK